jgi:protein arginine kinase activator
MRCDGCGNDSAVIQVQEVVDGKQSTIRLCAACAAMQRFKLSSVTGGAMEKLMESVAELASHLGGADAESPHFCSECGIDSQTIRKSGLVGCPHCYDEFRDLLNELHPGALPSQTAPAPPDPPRAPSLDELLAQAVAEERYEDAARIRDRIRTESSGVAE